MLPSLMEGKTVLRKVLLAVMLMSVALPAWSVQGALDTEGISFNTDDERIGRLRLGLTEQAVRGSIPCMPQKGREIFEGATGEHVQVWKFPDCGVELKMSADEKGAGKW